MRDDARMAPRRGVGGGSGAAVALGRSLPAPGVVRSRPPAAASPALAAPPCARVPPFRLGPPLTPGSMEVMEGPLNLVSSGGIEGERAAMGGRSRMRGNAG